MPLLSTSEALHVSDSFLSSLYGDVIFRRWKELKDEMKFSTEREYVSWLIDVANHYKNEDASQQVSQETQFRTSNVKSEEGLDHYIQSQGQSYETPVSEYSHLSSTQDTRNSKNCRELASNVEGTGNTVTSQVDDYNYEQSYYEDVGEDETVLEMERNEDIMFSSDNDGDEGEGDEGGSGAIDDGDGPSNAQQPANELRSDLELMLDPSSSKKYFTCPHCLYMSDRPDSIRRHIRNVHEGRKEIMCQYCDYKCSMRDKLKRHLICKHGLKSKYCCTNCQKYFHAPCYLQAHVKGCLGRGR